MRDRSKSTCINRSVDVLTLDSGYDYPSYNCQSFENALPTSPYSSDGGRMCFQHIWWEIIPKLHGTVNANLSKGKSPAICHSRNLLNLKVRHCKVPIVTNQLDKHTFQAPREIREPPQDLQDNGCFAW